MGWTRTEICDLDVGTEDYGISSATLLDWEGDIPKSNSWMPASSPNPRIDLSKMNTKFQAVVLFMVFIFVG